MKMTINNPKMTSCPGQGCAQSEKIDKKEVNKKIKQNETIKSDHNSY